MYKNKPICVVSAPLTSRSGYGTHTRLIVKSLIVLDRYDLKVIPTPWGSTPLDALDPNNPEDMKLINLIVDPRSITQQPDLWIQITIPNEMMRNGKVNVLITAGTEASSPPKEFVEGCNRADFVITPSEFTKRILELASFEIKDKNSGQVTGHLKVEKPLYTLFEGLETNKFSKGLPVISTVKDLINIPQEFAFLSTGLWLGGQLGEDRKDISGVIKIFLDTFKDKADRNKPALLLKTSGAGFSETENSVILNKIEQIKNTCGTFTGTNWPAIYLLSGDFTDEEMNTLYHHPKVKCMVSFTKGEGFGLPLLEFCSTGKPIICSKYSGPLDFLNPEYNILLPGKMTKIHHSAANQWLPSTASWFTVDYGYASGVMKDIVENYDKYLVNSKNNINFIKNNFSFEKMTEQFADILNYILPVQEVKQFEMPILNLPKL